MHPGLIPFAGMEVGFTDDPLGRVSLNLYICGCSKRCPGCCNPQLQESENAKEWLSVVELSDLVFEKLDCAGGLIECIVFLGGDWAERPVMLQQIARELLADEWPLVLYTGEYYHKLWYGIWSSMEVVVDGRWNQDSPGIFPPSTNQRVFVNGRCVTPEKLPLYKVLRDRKVGESLHVVA